MRCASRVLALPAALAVLAAAPAPPDPLAAIAAANGHPALVHVRASGSRIIEGRRVSAVFEQLGTSWLDRVCIADACSGGWFDGTRLFTFGLNDVALPEDDPQLATRRTLAAIASYAFAEPAFRAAGGTVRADGRDRYRVQARDGAELEAVIDGASRTVKRVERADGTTLATYGAEVRAGGATFPLERRSELDVGRLDSAQAVPGPLDIPRGAQPAFGGPDTVALGRDPVPVVACTIGSRSGRCLLDSGTTPSAIVLDFAEALGLEPRGELEITGFSRFVTGFVDAGPLTLGPARFDRVRLAVVPAVRAVRFDAVIGADLLARLHVVLDRRAGIVRLGPPVAPAAGRIALTFRGGRPELPVRIGGSDVTALFDTGDEGVLSLGYAEYRRGHQWPVTGRTRSEGLAGAEDAFTVEIPDVRIGSLALGASAATVRRTQEGAHVGVGLWARCALELDEAAAQLGCAGR